jgi:hypothetical protein
VSSQTVIIIVICVSIAALSLVGIAIQPKIALRRWQTRLRAMSIGELAAEAVSSADAAGIRSRFSSASLFAPNTGWDRDSLSRALDELYEGLANEDRRSGAAGPGSWVYHYYDFGLAGVHEILQPPARDRS